MKIRPDVVLFCIGILFCGRAAWDVVRFQVFQNHPHLIVAAHNSLAHVGHPARPGLQLLGRIEVPRLKLSTLVVDGDDEESLAYAAGHVPGTAPLGGSGNSAIAGHRESAFRELRAIRIGDSIRVVAADHKSYEYVVRSTQIVLPDNVRVLANAGNPTLTLITCYPFRYIGSAPKRFIVQAGLQTRLPHETAVSSVRFP